MSAATAPIDASIASGRKQALAGTHRVGTAVVLAASGAWAIGYASLALDRHWRYGSARFDLGNMVQAVWNTAHGRFLEMTLETGEQSSRLAVHVDPILALFAPAALLVPAPELLIVAQAIALASGAWPILGLARRHLTSEAAAVLIALAYLLNPWIVWQTQTDFHPVALAIPLFLYAVWFLDAGRYVAFAIATAFALMCGELMGLPLLGLGLWHAVSTRRWAVGAVIATAGAAWTFVCLWVVIPAVGGDHSPFYQHFEKVGGSPAGLLETAVTDPGALVSELLTAADVTYLILLALPLLGLFVAAPLLALAGLPLLMVNMLAGAPAMTSAREHYISGVIPFLFAATVVGVSRFGLRRRVMLTSLIFETSLVLGIAFAPWPGLVLPSEDHAYLAPANREAALAAIRLVPANAAVAATGAAGAQLSERRYIYSVPVVGRAEWVLIDRGDPLLGPGIPIPLAAFERRLRNEDRWRVVFERGNVVLYRRAGA